MSTSLAVRSGPVATLERSDDRVVGGMAPMSFEQVVQMGTALVQTGFLPDHIKNGAQAAAIILTGQELGMPPMRAIRSLQMVKGKVVESADSQLARFKRDGGHAVFRQLDESAAILFLRHPNGDEHEESFTADDARAAGLLGKEMYGKFRKAMLRSRVITAALKSIGWEGGVGNYDPSEALTFSGASSNAGSSSASSAQESTAPDEPLTLELALAMTLPGKATAWGNNGGKALGELSGKLLVGMVDWLKKKIAEQAEDGEEPDATKARILAACELILKAKGADAPAAPAAPASPAAPAAPAAPASTPASSVRADGSTAAPGNVADALEKKAPTMSDLARAADRILRHEKLSEPERIDFRNRLASASTLEQMREIIEQLEDIVDKPV